MTTYTGFVEGVRDGIAYASVRDESGQEFDCEFPANPDLREHRRFTLTFSTVPDVEITPEREAEINASIDKALGEGCNDDDY